MRNIFLFRHPYSELPLLNSLFFDKKWLPASSSKYCRHRKHYSSKNCVALLPWFRECHFDQLRLFKRTLCHVQSRNRLSRRLVEFSVSKWLKLTQFVLFAPLFDWKKQLSNCKTYKKYENEPLGNKQLLLCVSHNYRRPVMKIPELWWCRTEISTNNSSQFTGMWMSKCVI